jgi:hypothetical protein
MRWLLRFAAQHYGTSPVHGLGGPHAHHHVAHTSRNNAGAALHGNLTQAAAALCKDLHFGHGRPAVQAQRAGCANPSPRSTKITGWCKLVLWARRSTESPRRAFSE